MTTPERNKIKERCAGRNETHTHTQRKKTYFLGNEKHRSRASPFKACIGNTLHVGGGREKCCNKHQVVTQAVLCSFKREMPLENTDTRIIDCGIQQRKRRKKWEKKKQTRNKTVFCVERDFVYK